MNDRLRNMIVKEHKMGTSFDATVQKVLNISPRTTRDEIAKVIHDHKWGLFRSGRRRASFTSALKT